MNKNIIQAKNKFVALLVIFIVMQCAMLLILLSFADKMAEAQSLQEGTGRTIKMVGSIIIVIMSTIVDVTLYTKKIYRLKLISNIEPLHGKVEDFIIYSYGRDGNRLVFKISPLIRSSEDNLLYLTYGNYSASYYTTIEARQVNTLLCKQIVRSDGTKVQIGDEVYFYLIKTIKMKVKEDRKEHWFKLNGKSVKLNSINKKMDMNILENIVFFEGAVDVETTLN